MKKVLAALLSVFLIFGLGGAARADYYAQVYGTDSLNIRSGPGVEYAWLGSVANAGQVWVIGESGNWCRVITLDGTVSGYMSKNYLLPVGTGGGSSVSALTYGVVTNTESLNVRSGPGTEYGWLGSVSKGEWVQIDGESGNWYRVVVVATGLAGYMSKNFIQVWNGQGGSGTAVVQNPAGTRFLNMREYPSYDAAVLGIFYTGETVNIINRLSDGWVYASAEKDGLLLSGYFRGEYLSATGGSGGFAYVNTSGNGGNGGSLNLRSAPLFNAGVMRTIPNGSSVTVLLKGAKWWQIQYEGTTGFADSAFLGSQGGSVRPPVIDGDTAVVRTGNSGRLNLRQQANANAKVLGKYYNGTAVRVLQRGTAWCYVQVDGKTGYMMTKYLSLAGSAASKQVVNPNGGTYVNLRTSPEKTSGNVNVRVPVGASIGLLSWGQEWSQVSYNGATGYMMSWFLK